MQLKRTALFLTIPALLFALPLAGKKKPAGEEKKPVQASRYIATQVAAVIDANAPQRLNRNDIPLTTLPTLFLPAQQNHIYPVFLFQVKNADLNLVATAQTPDVLSAKFHVFTRLYKLENGALGAVIRERYIPFNLEESKDVFTPDAVNYYSIAGEIFPAGNYLLALAMSTSDFSKITVVFSEIALPDVAQLQGRLDSTPIFSVTGLKQIAVAETRLGIHTNSFVYNTLELSPKVSSEFKVGENLDLFFFILGARPDANNAYNMQVTYRFKKEGKEVRKLGPVPAAGVIVSQPIALTFTEITKNAKGVETDRKELKMEPGEYTLEVELLDNVSKAEALKEFKFRIVL